MKVTENSSVSDNDSDDEERLFDEQPSSNDRINLSQNAIYTPQLVRSKQSCDSCYSSADEEGQYDILNEDFAQIISQKYNFQTSEYHEAVETEAIEAENVQTTKKKKPFM